MANTAVFGVDTRVSAAGVVIPTGADLVLTAGGTTRGDYGNAPYIIGSLADATFLSSNPEWGFVDSAGNSRVLYERRCRPEMFRRSTDTSGDDTASFQRFRDGWQAKIGTSSSILPVTYVLELDREYTIKQPGALLQEGYTQGNQGLVIKGITRGARIIYDPTTAGPLIFNDNSAAQIAIRSLRIHGQGNASSSSLWESRANGIAQNAQFERLQITGNWGSEVWLLRSDSANNNSEISWINCFFALSNKSTIFKSLGTDQHLNYWFDKCQSQGGGSWVEMNKGGHVTIRDCDASGFFGGASAIYLISLLNQGHASGVCQATVDTFRVEHSDANARLLRSTWDQGQITICNYDGSSQAGAVNPTDNIHIEIPGTYTGPNICLRDSQIPGTMTVYGGLGWSVPRRISIENSKMLHAATPDAHATITADFDGAKPAVVYDAMCSGLAFDNQVSTGKQAIWGCNLGAIGTTLKSGTGPIAKHEFTWRWYDGGVGPNATSITRVLPLGIILTRLWFWLPAGATGSPLSRTITVTNGDGTVLATASASNESLGLSLDLSGAPLPFHCNTETKRTLTASVTGTTNSYVPMVILGEYLG